MQAAVLWTGQNMRKKSHSGNNDLALSYRIDSLPGPVRRVKVWNAMERFIQRGEELPDDWEITLRWRNSPKQPWREDEFQTAISESRQGFVGLVLGRIRRDRATWEAEHRVQSKHRGPKKGAASPKKRRGKRQRHPTRVAKRRRQHNAKPSRRGRRNVSSRRGKQHRSRPRK